MIRAFNKEKYEEKPMHRSFEDYAESAIMEQGNIVEQGTPSHCSILGSIGEGEFGTTCFASSAKTKAQEYLDFSKWDPPTGYSTGTVVK